ncbi:MAG: LysM domain-containing protein [Myxococcota bacterium]|jgi:hypothetical protein|nr:LysM domain-containing protein [Myxococcota bacterium]
MHQRTLDDSLGLGPPSPRRRILRCAAFFAPWLLLLLLPSLGMAQDELAAPAAGEAAPAEGGAEEGDAGSGELLGDYTPTARISKVRGLSPGQTANTHVVKSGETLWSITQTYFRDPYMWPALWAMNPHITNPHWIFPGDVVFIRPSAGVADNDGGDRSLGALMRFTRESGLVVLPAGYYTEADLANAGRVVFSPEEKRMLTYTDELNVDWEKEEIRKQVAPGQRFMVYRELDSAVNTETGEPLAKKLKLAGQVDIIHNDGSKLPTAVVSDAFIEIERGDLLLPAEEVKLRLIPITSSIDSEGYVIDVFEVITQLGEQQIMLINRGYSDGVSLGNRWLVFEQREGIHDLPEGDQTHTKSWAERHAEARQKEREGKRDRDVKLSRADDLEWPLGYETRAPAYPDEEYPEDDFRTEREYEIDDMPLRLIGEAMVVKVSERYCTAIVMDSSREFTIGTRVVTVAGY